MIIAEIGQNHCGDMELARKLIILAKDNGADLAKFQLYDSKKLYGEYQPTELTFNQAEELFNYGLGAGIEVFFSVFDVERVRWCSEIGVERYKIAYGMRNPDVLKAVWDTRKPTFCSCDLLNMPPHTWQWLYCISAYPAQVEDLDFNKMLILGGFSDHTIGLDAARIAIARGVKIIEKHFAIDHKTGVDAEWSMTPKELRELRRFINVQKGL